MGRKSEASDAEETTTPSKSSDRPDYDELVRRVNVIAQPMASRKLTKRLYRTAKKGELEICFLQTESDNCRCDKAATRKLLRRGVKDVVKGLKKGEKG